MQIEQLQALRVYGGNFNQIARALVAAQDALDQIATLVSRGALTGHGPSPNNLPMEHLSVPMCTLEEQTRRIDASIHRQSRANLDAAQDAEWNKFTPNREDFHAD